MSPLRPEVQGRQRGGKKSANTNAHQQDAGEHVDGTEKPAQGAPKRKETVKTKPLGVTCPCKILTSSKALQYIYIYIFIYIFIYTYI